MDFEQISLFLSFKDVLSDAHVKVLLVARDQDMLHLRVSRCFALGSILLKLGPTPLTPAGALYDALLVAMRREMPDSL